MKKIIANSSDKNSLGNSFRIKRFKFLAKKLENFSKPISILDVGGTVQYWEARGVQNNDDYKISIINLEKSDSPYSNIEVFKGDATNLSNLQDKSFDLAFSNSVIEHLTLVEKQVMMAKEIVRLGKYYFVQTPNRYFPIEPHFLFPFFQFLPYSVKYFILTKTKLSRGRKRTPERAATYIKEIRLLTTSEMLKLFSGCKVYFEKVAGLVKSITVHNLPD